MPWAATVRIFAPKPPGGQQPQVGQHQKDEKPLQLHVHLTPSRSAVAASAEATTSSCGTTSIRSRAMTDSMMPTRTARPRMPTSAKPEIQPGTGRQSGQTIPISRLPRIHIFRAAPYRMKAKSGPLWSSTMTSWIMVSSRCVFGSSTGIRQFSTRKTASRATSHEDQRRVDIYPVRSDSAARLAESSPEPVWRTRAARER